MGYNLQLFATKIHVHQSLLQEVATLNTAQAELKSLSGNTSVP